jgi:cytochrome c oxidase subunit 1
VKTARKRKLPPEPKILRDGPDFTGQELEDRLEVTWARPPGLIGWLASVDHKEIGRRYIITALAFLALGGLMAIHMRLQLMWPDNDLMDPGLFNETFTMHGSTMMFLFAVPIMQGVQIYLVPLMVGTRAMAFPRLTAFSYYMYLFGGLFLWVCHYFRFGPDNGWFSYVPLAGPQYGIGKRADVWAQMVTFTEVAALAVAVTMTATILKQRAPGMTLARMPIFVWATLVTSLMVIFSMPAVALVSSLLLSDRTVGTQFFNPAEHGDPLLWQHMFWFFGHPEVYIIFLPATGFVSEIVATFSRRAIFAYPIVVLSLVATGILAFGLWVHHMFATGLPRVGYSFYTAASMSVSIPTGLQIFCWIATIWEGRPRMQVPMLYIVGFIITFVIGGLSGVIIAAVPLDLELHDTYFIVAHFHYVLIGGAVFPLLGAITYWFPKFTGRLMSERMGRVSFWTVFLGFQLAFFPMHIAGLLGMPRRVYTYPAGMGLELPNMLSTIGSLVVAAGILLFVLNMLFALRTRIPAGPDPWDGATLEWATASPPRWHNFDHLPAVESRTPLWDATDGKMPVVYGLKVDERELVLTTVVTGSPETREPSAQPSIWPFISAVAVTVAFTASVFSPWGVAFGAIPVAIALIAWFWPKSPGPHADAVIA